MFSYYTQHVHQQHPVLAKPQLYDRSHISKSVAISLIFSEDYVSQSDGSFLWWLITCISGNGHPVLQAILSEVVCNGAWPQTHNVSFAMSMRCYRLQIHSSKVHELCLWHNAYNSISRVPIAKETGWSMVLWWVGRLTCIYLSCKVEEFHVSADELGKGIQQDPQVVLKNELTVLQVNDSISAIIYFCSVL